MYQSLYPEERFPQGQPDLAVALNNLGRVLLDQDSYDEARRYCERSLAMREKLYPKGAYPQGHPELAEPEQPRPNFRGPGLVRRGAGLL